MLLQNQSARLDAHRCGACCGPTAKAVPFNRQYCPPLLPRRAEIGILSRERPGARRSSLGRAPRAGRHATVDRILGDALETGCLRHCSTPRCRSAIDRRLPAPARTRTTARWITPFPSRLFEGASAIGLRRRVLPSSATHPRTVPRGTRFARQLSPPREGGWTTSSGTTATNPPVGPPAMPG